VSGQTDDGKSLETDGRLHPAEFPKVFCSSRKRQVPSLSDGAPAGRETQGLQDGSYPPRNRTQVGSQARIPDVIAAQDSGGGAAGQEGSVPGLNRQGQGSCKSLLTVLSTLAYLDSFTVVQFPLPGRGGIPLRANRLGCESYITFPCGLSPSLDKLGLLARRGNQVKKVTFQISHLRERLALLC